MGENILAIGIRANNMEMGNILMVKLEKKGYGNKGKE